MQHVVHRPGAAFALALALTACAPLPGEREMTVGGAGPADLIRDSQPLDSDTAPIVVRWEQTLAGAGDLNVYLYAPDDPAAACHLTAGATIDFHCENHAGTIAVRGVETSAPHEVTVTLRRDSATSGLAVAQDGTAATMSRAQIPGTPDVAAGQRLRVRFSARGSASAQIGGFTVDEIN